MKVTSSQIHKERRVGDARDSISGEWSHAAIIEQPMRGSIAIGPVEVIVATVGGLIVVENGIVDPWDAVIASRINCTNASPKLGPVADHGAIVHRPVIRGN